MKNIMEVPQIIKDEAKKHKLLQMEYVGMYGNAQVYAEVNPIDEEGVVEPTGLPCLLLLENDVVKPVYGFDAFDVLDLTK